MTKQISASDARANLPTLLDEVAAGEEVTITRHGKPVAVLVRPRRLRDPTVQRWLDDADRMEEQRRARRGDSFELLDTPDAYFDEWIAEIRAGRDAD
ncbi:MAG: type II toxin-antitoxin system Phd/YefM family antitoxin [Frankiaceae bacterium]|nr:type II toxin-antitoxin system Phd/YefM family antitoxin [Frankiaceae bacterium]MBV9872517.1 type II toxin-antitoxin system Phd/YefM family antitoxin [Frankiaceae bacterium]